MAIQSHSTSIPSSPSELEFPNYDAALPATVSGQSGRSEELPATASKKEKESEKQELLLYRRRSANEDMIRRMAETPSSEAAPQADETQTAEAPASLHARLLAATTLTDGLLSLKEMLGFTDEEYKKQFGEDDILMKQAYTSRDPKKERLLCSYSRHVIVVQKCRRDKENKEDPAYIHDMVRAQVEKIGLELDTKFLVHDRIVSDDIWPFLERHPELSANDGLMKENEFEDFMSDVVNGKNCTRILALFNKGALNATLYNMTVVFETKPLET